jgi:hypothetical protein
VHHCAVDALAVSIACLQVPTSAALPCGVDAAVLKVFRWASKDVFRPGAACGAFAAILVRHASYFLMYSSHSGTPVPGSVESALAVSVFAGAVVVVVVDDVVVVAVFAVLLAFAGLVAVVFVAVLPQPNERIAKQSAAAIAIKLVIFIKLIFLTNIFSSEYASAIRSEDKEHLQLVKILTTLVEIDKDGLKYNRCND